MPLAGIIDPTHKEREDDEPGRYPSVYSVDDLLAMAANADPKWSNWSYELIAAAIREWQERGDNISVTMLVGECARAQVIARREPYFVALDELYAALRGTQVHRTLEYSARPGSVAETRFTAKVHVPGYGEVDLSCTPDLITPDGTLWDYKTTENPPPFNYPYRKHRRQLEFNRYVVNHAVTWAKDGKPTALPWQPQLFEFKALVVVYLGPKGPKPIVVEESYDHRTPNNRIVRRRRPAVAQDEVVEADLVPRLQGMVMALESYPEWPQGLEQFPGFFGPPTWACPGPPLCRLPGCLAKRWPNGLTWETHDSSDGTLGRVEAVGLRLREEADR